MGFVVITSGTLRGRKIAAPAGAATRPLLTRLRKSLADILRPRLPGARVLDMFGGSGAIAFELMSNGATRATIVELHQEAADLIRRNAAALGVAAAVTIVRGDALAVAAGLRQDAAAFDLIVIAPPYGRGLQQPALDAACGRKGLLAPDGLIVVQRERAEPACILPGGMRPAGSRAYGRTLFDFYVRAKP